MAECKNISLPQYQLTLDELEAQIIMELIGSINDHDSDKTDPYYKATQNIYRALDACGINMPEPFRVMVVVDDDGGCGGASLLIKRERDE